VEEQVGVNGEFMHQFTGAEGFVQVHFLGAFAASPSMTGKVPLS
jgi:hypothetical protein